MANGEGVRGVVMGWSRPATVIPYLIENWQAGRVPFDKMITVFDFDDFERGRSGHAEQTGREAGDGFPRPASGTPPDAARPIVHQRCGRR
ncbi:hypothetical protein [uncultured Jatrophihabitans sp.]|uniref:hypothetical protein n=1 Tax=uncultured Jatrophihabitans sp. TaxID=1610747 RepID=UPI0035CBF5BD